MRTSIVTVFLGVLSFLPRFPVFLASVQCQQDIKSESKTFAELSSTHVCACAHPYTAIRLRCCCGRPQSQWSRSLFTSSKMWKIHRFPDRQTLSWHPRKRVRSKAVDKSSKNQQRQTHYQIQLEDAQSEVQILADIFVGRRGQSVGPCPLWMVQASLTTLKVSCLSGANSCVRVRACEGFSFSPSRLNSSIEQLGQARAPSITQKCVRQPIAQAQHIHNATRMHVSFYAATVFITRRRIHACSTQYIQPYYDLLIFFPSFALLSLFDCVHFVVVAVTLCSVH